jgi:hypothetical protein
MKKIKIDTREFNVPESWKEVSLKHYESFYDLKRDTKTDEVRLVSAVSTIPFNILTNLSLSFYTEILNSISFIFENIQYKPLSYIKDTEGNTYYVNTKDELTLGQWVDIDSISEDAEDKRKLSEILSIVCLKKTEKYQSELLEVRKEMFGSLPMSEIFPVLTFFLKLNERLERITELYLKLQGKIEPYQPNIETLPEVGGGKR